MLFDGAALHGAGSDSIITSAGISVAGYFILVAGELGLSRQQAPLAGDGERLGPGLHAELSVHVRKMRFHGRP